MASRIFAVDDCCPEGFRWLTLKRITVGGLTVQGGLCAVAARAAAPLQPSPLGSSMPLMHAQWEDPHGRQRQWESAERTTRRGEVDACAIVAKV